LVSAQVIADTKAQLEDAGVDPDTLVSAAAAAGAGKGGQKLVKRSGIAILLKNLPYEGDQDELRTMCEKFGVVSRFVLPDTKTIAVVEFLEPTDARKAFKGLAYKRYKHVPIYVEWAPVGIFVSDAPTVRGIRGGNSAGADVPNAAPRADAAVHGASDEKRTKTDDDDEENASRLFVKGLSFQTSEQVRNFPMYHIPPD
tara:strand:+ start:696 stop:1292 length:597 start_codon:yes stop_codon:yes gene_type:complete